MNDSTYCARVRERLYRYVDDELPATEQALDRGHMECCAACSQEREVVKDLILSTRAALAPDPSELKHELNALRPRLTAAKLRPRALRLLRKRSTISLLTAAAAVLILMALEGDDQGLSFLGGTNLFEVLGVAEWRLPLGTGLLEVK